MTYAPPKDGWVCFHCGKRYRTYREAERHFGKTPGSLAACVEDIERLRGINGAQEMEIACYKDALGWT